MVTLIGSGGHANDIAGHGVWNRVSHHRHLGKVYGNVRIVIGVNDPQLRAKVATELGIADETWIHPDAKLYVDVKYGTGVHINYGAQMTRTILGDHVTISPGVTICGDVTIGDRVMVGAGAVICNLVTIGDDAVIGAGSIILSDVPAGATVVGAGRTVHHR